MLGASLALVWAGLEFFEIWPELFRQLAAGGWRPEWKTLTKLAALLAVPAAGAAVGGLAAGALQSLGRLHRTPKHRAQLIAPRAVFERLLRTALGALTLAALWLNLRAWLPHLTVTLGNASLGLDAIVRLTQRLFGLALVMAAGWAVYDAATRYVRWRRSLFMSHRELIDEQRSSQGGTATRQRARTDPPSAATNRATSETGSAAATSETGSAH